jgi:hypothetical protein
MFDERGPGNVNDTCVTTVQAGTTDKGCTVFPNPKASLVTQLWQYNN